MASTSTFYIVDTTRPQGVISPTSGFLSDLSVTASTPPINQYISVVHDGEDGFVKAADQANLFTAFYVNPIIALGGLVGFDFVEDSSDPITGVPGTPPRVFGANMPASAPNRLSATYSFYNSDPLPSNWKFEVHWGNIDSYSKEYFLKRIYRLALHQLRDNDNNKMLAKSAFGAYWYAGQGLVQGGLFGANTGITNFNIVPSQPVSYLTPIITDILNLSPVGNDVNYQLAFTNPGSPALSSAAMQAIFTDFIKYKTNGQINVSSLSSWITFTGNSPMLVNIAAGTDPQKSVIAMQINDLVQLGVYSVYDRLAFELATDVAALLPVSPTSASTLGSYA